MLEPAGARDVRTAAEIDERAVGVHGDRFVRPQFADPLQLERVVGEAPVRLLARHDFPHERIVLRRDLAHLLLDHLEVFRRERARYREIVVEPLVNGRAESDPGVREDLAHRGGEDVRRGVAQHRQRVGVALGEDRQPGTAGERPAKVLDLAVDANGDRRTRQAGADLRRELGTRGTLGQFAFGAVRKRDADLVGHRVSCDA